MAVDRRTFDQRASAACSYRLTWPEADVRVESTLQVDLTADGYDVPITADAYDDRQHVSHRSWTEHVPR